ncbi:metal-dependent hydrolase, beta-lactamase superfamily [Geobacter sulfurreducens PCA]|jgi:phosphoribosyl 1,2-cyclic phosphodiesterase|uniref:Metal-dependent hydrolase, beta-lactamase superfamily n=1 Tax=Geobacter sulfurreducens (strain ATCC 51573 / DSM 12127 / PCA) TaxID=243231 RepID=Q74CP2_GEOSL|nr:metal-dependent hydrolase, beta-lactamase superfamily [Geobacter sulfurreducens PCA]
MNGGCVRVCLLASGSKGNSLFIETGESRILIDAGLSARELVRRLSLIGVDAAQLDALFISHEHTDHVRGAGVLARKYRIPVHVSYPTHREISGQIHGVYVTEFESGYSFTFRDLLVDPFRITHDACDPVGFTVESREGKVGIATDLGTATRLVADKLAGCRALVVESNHDEGMLMDGPYPWHLKQRIKSRHGHLSNNDTAALLAEVINPGLEGLFLAHLSEVNNDPVMARQVTASFLAGQNICSPRLVVGDQYRPSELLNI